MLFLAMFYYGLFFHLLKDLEFMNTFAKYLGSFVLFILPTSEFADSVAHFLYLAFSTGFHTWASFVISVYILTKQFPTGVHL